MSLEMWITAVMAGATAWMAWETRQMRRLLVDEKKEKEAREHLLERALEEARRQYHQCLDSGRLRIDLNRIPRPMVRVPLKTGWERRAARRLREEGIIQSIDDTQREALFDVCRLPGVECFSIGGHNRIPT